MKIAIDFDGTIVEHRFPEIGPEKPHAIEALLRLKSAGVVIILWTCRAGPYLQEAVEWLNKRGVYPDAVNEDPDAEENEFGFPKVATDYYLDDKAVPPFFGWEKFLKWAEASHIV